MNKKQKHNYEKSRKHEQNNEHNYKKNKKCEVSENHEYDDKISTNH